MPKKTETITVADFSNATTQAIALGTLEQLNWELKYAAENMLIAYTHTEWRKQAEAIYIETNDNLLTVTSKMIHNESFDPFGKNKKNIKKFLAAFEGTKNTSTEQQQTGWKEAILPVKEETIKAAEKEVREAEEVDKVMNLSKSNLYITYGIIAINVLVFIVMAISGVSLFNPSALDILKWGANYLPLTASGEWWRLLSCVFVHIGIIHLLFNMYALFMVGVYLEPLLGKRNYIIAYLCTGVFASLASLWWHDQPVPSAGASGAIFGMYGVFLALLSTNLIPKKVRNALLQSIGVFVVYNLVYGMKSGVDNAAHLGGLLSGLIIGYIFYLLIKKKEEGGKSIIVTGAIVLVTVAFAALYLEKESKKIDPLQKKQITNAIRGAADKDGQKFLEKYDAFIEAQNRALAPLSDTTLTNEELSAKLNQLSTPEWEKAQQLITELMGYDVSAQLKEKAEVTQQYVILRQNEITILLRVIKENKIEDKLELDAVREKINAAVVKLNNL